MQSIGWQRREQASLWREQGAGGVENIKKAFLKEMAAELGLEK